MEGIAVPIIGYRGEKIEWGDFVEMVDINSSGVFIEPERVIILNPTKSLIDFFKDMGIEYRKLSKSEVDRYVREVLGLIKEEEEEEKGV